MLKESSWKRKHDSRKPRVADSSASLVYGKVPPQAPELEEAVLGAMLLEKDKQTEVLGILPEIECFYLDAHQKIFAAIRTLYNASAPVDLLTVTEQLRKTSELEIVGGPYYLTKLTLSVVSSAHAGAHARIIQEKYMLRELIRISGMVIAAGYEDSTDVFELMDVAESSLFAVSAVNIRKAYEHAHELARVAREAYLRRQQYQDTVAGVPSGYRALDALTNGWKKKAMIIIAARPSVGKTAFCLNLALNAALAGQGVGIFSLEMGSDEVTNIMLAALGRLPLDGIVKGNLAEHQQEAYFETNAAFGKLNIKVDDTASLNIYELRTKARRMVEKDGVQLILIDYLQLMHGVQEGAQSNREQEIARISRGIKVLAKELDIPIIALSQMSRAVESRHGANKRPQLSDLRESGSIEQDSDVVMFLSRPDYQKAEDDVDPAVMDDAEIILAKNRGGRIDDVAMKFVKSIQCWMSLSDYEQYRERQNPQQWTQPQQFDNPQAGMGGSRMFIQAGAGGSTDNLPF